MQIKPEQLAAHLGNQLLPLYVISGEEPLQREESIDAIRAAAPANLTSAPSCMSTDVSTGPS